MSTLERLKAAGARIDGLAWDERGNLIFHATQLSGPWSEEQKERAVRLLGRKAAP